MAPSPTDQDEKVFTMYLRRKDTIIWFSQHIFSILKITKMKKKNWSDKWRNSGFVLAILMLIAVFSGNSVSAQSPVKNVVLVHGAFAGSTGWKALYEILTTKGYHVTIVQNPLTSLED